MYTHLFMQFIETRTMIKYENAALFQTSKLQANVVACISECRNWGRWHWCGNRMLYTY